MYKNQPHVLKTLLSISIPVTNTVTALQLQQSISLLDYPQVFLHSTGTIWHLLCSLNLFYTQHRDLVGAASLTSFPWCHHHIACCSVSWPNAAFLRFLFLHRALPYTILDPTRKCWCTCAMRPCWGTRTTLGPSLSCQQQTISFDHETPPLQSQCCTWQAEVHSSPLTDSKQQCEWSVLILLPGGWQQKQL